MGLPLWREPEEREPDNSFDPAVARRSAIRRPVRQSRTAAAASRPRARSSQTLFDLLRNDYAQDSVSLRERREYWNDVNALPTPVPDQERAALRVTLPEIETPRIVRNYRPIIRLRSEGSRASSSSVLSGESFTPRFPPASLPRYMDTNEGRRYRSSLPAPAAAGSAPASASPNGEGSSSSRRSDSIVDRVRPHRIPRYNEPMGEETEPLSRPSSYVPSSTSRNWFDVDGLGDRERSLSPDDALPWEAVAHDLGLQSCDFYESDSEGEVAASGNDMLWEFPDAEDHFRIRRLTSFLSRNRELDRVTAERL